MCAIVGALFKRLDSLEKLTEANRILNHIWIQSHARGRDGRGFVFQKEDAGLTVEKSTRRGVVDITPTVSGEGILIGNIRAEPTTEFVLDKRKDDQQPYSQGAWSIVHNGTIANDKELRTYQVPTLIDSAAIAEALASQSRHQSEFDQFATAVKHLKGSYAILAISAGGDLFVACNYRPVWYAESEVGVYFASSREYFPEGMTPVMVKPYSVGYFSFTAENEIFHYLESLRPSANNKALVVCSGGLDSVVAATYAQRTLGYDISLIHFLYGSRAEGPEVEAVKQVAEFLGVSVKLFPLAIYSKSDSPLLDPDSKVAGGEAGAEFAHEWVPARNLLLLSVATAYAEANGYDLLVLGNNLEEAGAYPDNEPEFIDRFNDLLPFAVGDGKQLKVLMPVGNMMKHEIVKLGHTIGAPMHLTWSCYRAGTQHCGTCGPCYMRKKAFEMNQLDEVIEYDHC